MNESILGFIDDVSTAFETSCYDTILQGNQKLIIIFSLDSVELDMS